MKTLKMVLFLMVLGLTTNAQNIDLKKGLLGYWAFNNNLIDQSESSGNAKGYNIKYTFDENGNSIGACEFKNNAYIELPKTALNNMVSGSIVTKIFLYSLNIQHTIIDKTITGRTNYFQLIIDNNNKLRVIFNDEYFKGNTSLYSNTYYHIVCTFNGQNINLFINGKLDASYPCKQKILFAERSVLVGKVDNNTAFMNGKMDELRIYNRALSENEILSLYSNKSDVSTTTYSDSYNSDNTKNLPYNLNNIDKKEINLTVTFSKDYYPIDKPDLSKYEITVIKKQAKKGDLASLVTYGDMFYYGYDKIERNEVEAILNYKKAADQGNALAQYKLATIYRQNRATVSDAVKYYDLAVVQNYEPAIYDLAILYLNGSGGISKDYVKAKELLQKIPSNQKAKTELGKLYLSSDITTFGLKADLQLAKSLLQDAGQISIYNEWLSRLDNFGKFRYALSKLPTLVKDINIEIDFKNETQLRTLIEQLNLQSDILGPEKIKKYTYDLIDNLDVVNSTISKQYEDELYQTALKSKSPAKLKAFVNRFPNSTYRKSALDEITNLDIEKFKQAKSNNTVYSYQQYLDLFPLGLNADEARNKIKQIEQEEKQALEKQQEEERQAKIKAQQDKANAEYEYEQNRKNSITNASVGDRLCFSQGWTRTESFFFMPYTAANYTMSIICFIERKEGENYQVRIADVSSSKSGEYSSPNINGVKVNKGDVIWVKPLNDSKWHKCD